MRQVAQLKSRGVKFAMEPMDATPICHFAIILDPDGNNVMHPQAQSLKGVANFQFIQSHMSILVKPNTKVLVQGITGSFGAKHAQLSIDYGTPSSPASRPAKADNFSSTAAKRFRSLTPLPTP